MPVIQLSLDLFARPEPQPHKHYDYSAFSFGGGVQSTAIYLLLKHEPEKLLEVMGHLPDKAYFADTGAEPTHVYHHIEMLKGLGSPIPLEVVSYGNIVDFYKNKKRSHAPFFVDKGLNAKGKPERGMLWRTCTDRFKIEPLEKAIKRDAGIRYRQRCDKPQSISMWLGISTDEAVRMRLNKTKWFENVYPLIELGWSRTDCIEYCATYNIKPPKSRCFFCPYVRDWDKVKQDNPEEYAKAVEFDRYIRDLKWANVQYPAYLHQSLKPLDQVYGAVEDDEDGFMNECSGHCGV